MLSRLGDDSTGRNLYLTFDDGPNPEYTPPLLDFLDEHDAKASFFLIGEQIERHPAIAKRIAEAGRLGQSLVLASAIRAIVGDRTIR